MTVINIDILKEKLKKYKDENNIQNIYFNFNEYGKGNITFSFNGNTHTQYVEENYLRDMNIEDIQQIEQYIIEQFIHISITNRRNVNKQTIVSFDKLEINNKSKYINPHTFMPIVKCEIVMRYAVCQL